MRNTASFNGLVGGDDCCYMFLFSCSSIKNAHHYCPSCKELLGVYSSKKNWKFNFSRKLKSKTFRNIEFWLWINLQRVNWFQKYLHSASDPFALFERACEGHLDCGGGSCLQSLIKERVAIEFLWLLVSLIEKNPADGHKNGILCTLLQFSGAVRTISRKITFSDFLCQTGNKTPLHHPLLHSPFIMFVELCALIFQSNERVQKTFLALQSCGWICLTTKGDEGRWNLIKFIVSMRKKNVNPLKNDDADWEPFFSRSSHTKISTTTTMARKALKSDSTNW